MLLVSVIAWIFTGLLLALSVVCVAAGQGLIPKNHFAGIRLPSLMQSGQAWRQGHAAGVMPSAIAFFVALAASVIGLGLPAFSWVSIAAFAGGVIIVFLRASRAAVAASRTDPEAS